MCSGHSEKNSLPDLHWHMKRLELNLFEINPFRNDHYITIDVDACHGAVVNKLILEIISLGEGDEFSDCTTTLALCQTIFSQFKP